MTYNTNNGYDGSRSVNSLTSIHMSVIIYARVSTGEQAEKDLSIPAQLRALRQLAKDKGWPILAEFQDVGSGRAFRQRPGLMQAVKCAISGQMVEAILVHKVDRLCRNIFDYLTLKSKLRQHGVKLFSLVEHFENNPMGEFLEHIMAAQAEFYSANLSLEAKKGLEERVRRGQWVSRPPIGYAIKGSRLVLDPARAHLVRRAFEVWSTGTVTVHDLADQLEQEGLVGKTGRPISEHYCYSLLRNQFYIGFLVVHGQVHPGTHPPLISRELFNECQAVFVRKRRGAESRTSHLFVLAGKIVCPLCGRIMTGEEHVKPSRREYRYYRCHTQGCTKMIRCADIETQVVQVLIDLMIPEKAIPLLKRKMRKATSTHCQETTARVRVLRAERCRLDQELQELSGALAGQRISLGYFEHRQTEIIFSIRATEALIFEARQAKGEVARGDAGLLDVAMKLKFWLESGDNNLIRQGMDTVVTRVFVGSVLPQVELKAEWRELIDERIRTSNAPTSHPV